MSDTEQFVGRTVLVAVVLAIIGVFVAVAPWWMVLGVWVAVLVEATIYAQCT